MIKVYKLHCVILMEYSLLIFYVEPFTILMTGVVTGNGMARFRFVHLLTIRFDQLLSLYDLADRGFHIPRVLPRDITSSRGPPSHILGMFTPTLTFLGVFQLWQHFVFCLWATQG